MAVSGAAGGGLLHVDRLVFADFARQRQAGGGIDDRAAEQPVERQQGREPLFRARRIERRGGRRRGVGRARSLRNGERRDRDR